MKIFQFIKFLKAVINTIFGRGAILLLPFLPGIASCQHSAFFNAGEPLLLDVVPGATAAYSVRQLSSTYTGSAVEVRRASDNATQQIGFYGGEIDLGILTSFCNGTDCFVRTWYDQSGNGNHSSQTTAGSQPKIYDSSTGVVLENGKPAIDFDGTDAFQLGAGLITDIGVLNQAFSVFTVATRDNNNISSLLRLRSSSSGSPIHALSILDSGSGNYAIFFQRNSVNTVVSNISSFTVGTDQNLLDFIYSGNTIEFFKNSISGGAYSHVFATPTVSYDLGGIGAGFYPDYNTFEFPINGRLQEMIIYKSDKASNRLGIETNVNNFFSIY